MRKSSRDNGGKKSMRNNVDGVSVITEGADKHTARQQSLEDTLRENTELFQGVFNQAAVGMALTGPDRKIVQANRKMCDFLGYEFEELLDTTLRAAIHPDFVAQVDEQIRKLVDGEVESATIESMYVRKDGTLIWGELTSSLIRDEHGAPKFFLSVIQNIDDRNRAEAEAKNTKKMLELSQRIAHVGHWEWDPDSKESEWSEETFRIFGLNPKDEPLTSQVFLQRVLHEADRPALERAMQDTLRTGNPYAIEFRIARPDGEVCTIFEHGERYVAEQTGRPRIRGVFQDITERKAAEEKLRETAENLEKSQRIAKLGSWVWEIEEDKEWWSDEIYRMLGSGLEPAVVGGRDYLEYVHPDDRERVSAALDQSLREKVPYVAEYRVRHTDGHEIIIAEHAETEYDKAGRPVRMRGITQDITERKQIEQELRESEQRLNAFFVEAPAGLVLYDKEGRFIRTNETIARINGIAAEAHVGKRPTEILPPALGREIEEANRRTLETGAKVFNVELSTSIPTNPQETGHYVYSRFPIPGPDGEPLGVGAVVVDITDRKRVEDDLRQREQELSQAQRIGGIGHWRLDVRKHEFTYWSDELYRIFGVDKDNFIPTFDRYVAAVHPDDLQASIDNREAAFAEKRPYNFEYRIVRPSGEIRVIWGEARPEFDENGEPTMVFGITQDVTEARQQESEFRQAQKMEVVGRLTGGVAHDFNNLLGVMIGNLELAQEAVGPGSEAGRLLDSVVRAADRGAALTQQLLAFSRKQPLHPQLVKAHELVDDTLGLLQRTLDKTVEIEIVSNDDLWACLVDPTQLESAILNLAINAHDAMPDGGKLTIETSNAQIDDEYSAAQVEVDPGEYVLLAISDSGSGISPDVLEHVFEPFFTTKDVGVGSGLGLSMVHGFIKQSGGHITVYSEVGEGTTIRLYLPRHLGDGGHVPKAAEDNGLAMARNEMVLVVEDDEDLRTLVVNMLQSLGYNVLDSGTGKGALDILDKTRQVDLLLTDVMLPGGMSGKRLADLVKDRNPDLPILYMSGYTENAIIHQRRLEKGIHLLQKPFRRKDIAQAVRRILDGPPT